MRTYDRWVGLGVIVAVLAPCTTVNAITRLVRSTGADSLTCGTAASPCRSITQAIANASDGDAISVGPGVYGDTNGDGVLSGTGGEEPNNGACMQGSCMIRVNKSVKISSTDGAGATIVRAPAGLNLDAVVSLESADAALGKRNKGFSVVGGLNAQVFGFPVSGLSVVGNRILPGADTAISVGGDDVVVSDNIAIGGNLSPATGIAVGGNGFRVQRNIVTGFSTGFTVGGTEWTMVGNVATDNSGSGIIIALGGQLGPPSRFEKNAVVGNPGFGILVNVFGPSATTLTLERGNLFANGEADANCGVYLNVGIVLPGDLTVNLDEYFWGAPSGPGPNPADSIGGPFCESVDGTLTVNVTNVEPKPHTIKVPPQR